MHLTEKEREIVALLRHNPLLGSAALAGELGTTRAAVNVHLSNLGKKGVIRGRGYVLNEEAPVVVIGGANMDIKARSAAPATHQTSNPGHTTMSPGGVGRNIAENLARLGTRTHLVSAVGADALGDQILSRTAAAGVHTDLVRRTAEATGTYTAVLDNDGELLLAVADMAATDALTPADLDSARDLIATASMVIMDGNLATPTLQHGLALAAAAGVKVVLDPVSAPKAARLAPLLAGPIFAITPNRDELAALTGGPVNTERRLEQAVARLHTLGIEHVWVRLGRDGSLLSGPDGDTRCPAAACEVVDVTGAGDATLAAFCHAVLNGASLSDAVSLGHRAAAATIASPHTVRPDLTERLIRSQP